MSFPVPPNVEDPDADLRALLNISSAVMMVFSISAVGLRFLSRRLIRVPYLMDDWLILAALVRIRYNIILPCADSVALCLGMCHHRPVRTKPQSLWPTYSVLDAKISPRVLHCLLRVRPCLQFCNCPRQVLHPSTLPAGFPSLDTQGVAYSNGRLYYGVAHCMRMKTFPANDSHLSPYSLLQHASFLPFLH